MGFRGVRGLQKLLAKGLQCLNPALLSGHGKRIAPSSTDRLSSYLVFFFFFLLDTARGMNCFRCKSSQLMSKVGTMVSAQLQAHCFHRGQTETPTQWQEHYFHRSKYRHPRNDKHISFTEPNRDTYPVTRTLLSQNQTETPRAELVVGDKGGHPSRKAPKQQSWRNFHELLLF